MATLLEQNENSFFINSYVNLSISNNSRSSSQSINEFERQFLKEKEFTTEFGEEFTRPTKKTKTHSDLGFSNLFQGFVPFITCKAQNEIDEKEMSDFIL